MTLRALIAGGGLMAMAMLASCTSTPEKPAALPPPTHAYKVAQVERPGAPTAPSYEVCQDCPRPTRKTLPSTEARMAAAAAAMPVATPPVPRPPQQPVPRAPRQLTGVIQFDLNSATLTAEAKKQLAAWAPVMRSSLQVQVTGFTDNLGNQALNTRLADARALNVLLSVREQLSVDGKSPSISATGRPLCCYVADNRTESQRQPNRRAEVRITVQDTAELPQLLRMLAGNAKLVEQGGAALPPVVAASASNTTTAQQRP